MMEWIWNNKEWLFSGIATALVIAILGWFFASKKNGQTQKGGHHSTNIQVGRDIRTDRPKKDD